MDGEYQIKNTTAEPARLTGFHWDEVWAEFGKCSVCGYENEKIANFCIYCGSRFVKDDNQ